MSRYGIIVNVDRCAGCFACAVACKEENQVAPGIFWEKIKRDENVRDNVINWFRMSCMHCDDPACMKVCPMKAIHKGPHGEVLVDQQKCIGCKMCANACPYDVPVFNTEGRTSYFGDKQPLVVRPAKPHTERMPGKAEHCTLCVHRTERGLLPACVEACGIHAMTLVEYVNPPPETAKLIEAARPMNEAAGTHPKIRYIARHMDAAKMAVKLG